MPTRYQPPRFVLREGSLSPLDCGTTVLDNRQNRLVDHWAIIRQRSVHMGAGGGRWNRIKKNNVLLTGQHVRRRNTRGL